MCALIPRETKFAGCEDSTVRQTCTVFFATRKSWTLEPSLAFDESCRFDTSAFFMHIKRGSLYTHKESRSTKTVLSIES
jgi:hypothetical protein